MRWAAGRCWRSTSSAGTPSCPRRCSPTCSAGPGRWRLRLGFSSLGATASSIASRSSDSPSSARSPAGVVTNSRLAAGDVLVLTKPLGAGIITTGLRQGRASNESVQAAVTAMTTLNDKAAAVAVDGGVTSMTDVTGFGLLGHLHKMSSASGVRVTLDAAAVPVLPGALELAEQGVVSGGGRRNLEWVLPHLDVAGAGDSTLALLADPQTSGGLLAGFRRDDVAAAVDAFSAAGIAAAIVGEASPGRGDAGGRDGGKDVAEIVVSGEIPRLGSR